MPEVNNAVLDAVNKAGDVKTLAQALGVSRQIVYAWLHSGHVPPVRAIQIEEKYGVDRGRLVDPTLRAFLNASAHDAQTLSDRLPYRPFARRQKKSPATNKLGR